MIEIITETHSKCLDSASSWKLAFVPHLVKGEVSGENVLGEEITHALENKLRGNVDLKSTVGPWGHGIHLHILEWSAHGVAALVGSRDLPSADIVLSRRRNHHFGLARLFSNIYVCAEGFCS